MNFTKKIAEYPTKYEEGFIQSEIDALLKELHQKIDADKFNSALDSITVLMKDDEMIIYKHDIAYALKISRK